VGRVSKQVLSEQKVEGATAKLNFYINQLLNANVCVMH